MAKDRTLSIIGRMPLLVAAVANPVGAVAFAAVYIGARATARVTARHSVRQEMVREYNAALDAADADPGDPQAAAWVEACEERTHPDWTRKDEKTQTAETVLAGLFLVGLLIALSA